MRVHVWFSLLSQKNVHVHLFRFFPRKKGKHHDSFTTCKSRFEVCRQVMYEGWKGLICFVKKNSSTENMTGISQVCSWNVIWNVKKKRKHLLPCATLCMLHAGYIRKRNAHIEWLPDSISLQFFVWGEMHLGVTFHQMLLCDIESASFVCDTREEALTSARSGSGPVVYLRFGFFIWVLSLRA